jgi:MFS family permease
MSQLSSIWQLYLFYGLISIGMSAVLVPTLSTVARWFVKMRSFMTGIVLAGTGIALMVIVPAANQAIFSYGWRTVYIIVGSVVIVVVVIAAQFLRRDPYQVGKLPYGYDGTSTAASGEGTYGLSFKEALHTKQVWLISLFLRLLCVLHIRGPYGYLCHRAGFFINTSCGYYGLFRRGWYCRQNYNGYPR